MEKIVTALWLSAGLVLLSGTFVLVINESE